MEKELCYIGAKIIRASKEAKNGMEGYKVIYPDGYVNWFPKDTFEEVYRGVSDSEKKLMDLEYGAVVK